MECLHNYSAKKIIFKNLTLNEAENFPKHYWFENVRSLGKSSGIFSDTSRLISNEDNITIRAKNIYYYRKNENLKYYDKPKEIPYIAKMTRICEEYPELNIIIKIYPNSKKENNNIWVLDETSDCNNFNAVIEIPKTINEISHFYIDISKDIAKKEQSRAKLKKGVKKRYDKKRI